jgi:hypothetical protein
MKRALMAVLASVLAACTSVTRAMVTPDQLHELAGLSPSEERGFTPRGHHEMLYVRGDDEVSLLVAPGDPPRNRKQPWVRLCDLHWDPSGSTAATGGAPAVDDGVLLMVPAGQVAGAELEMRRADTGKTVALVAAIVLGVAVVAVAAVAVVAIEVNSQL